MRRRLLLCAYFCVCLVLIYPISVFAKGDDSLLLSEGDSKLILKELQRELTEQGTLNFPFLKPEEQVAIFLARDASRKAVFDFLPWFVTTETIQTVIKVANFAKRIPELTVKDFFEELESKTVREAIKLGTDWFFQNEIKISSGEIQGSYLSYWGGQSQVKFQYLMTYAENTQSSGDLIFEFYSANPIDPPAQSSIGFPWEIGDWLVQRKKKLDPFIVHVDTRVIKSGLGWVLDSSADTKITVEFPEKVPVLKLAKELPYPLEEQKIKLLNYWTTAKKILEYLRSTGSEALGKAADFAHKVQEITKGVVDYASKLIGQGGAGLVDPFSKESQQIDFIESQLNLVKEVLKAKEDQTKLSLAKDELVKDEVELGLAKDEAKDITKPSLVENEPQSVENLIELSFPQEQLILDSVKDSQPQIQVAESESAPELSSVKDTTVKDTVWCAIDPNRGSSLSTVMFSEIAWMGSVNSANDEWMKLKNISNSEVILEGWQLQDADNQIQISFKKEHSISSQSTLVLERTNDDSLPGTQAHVVYTGALNNTNEALYLFDEKCILRDKVVAGPDWLAGDSVSKKPMTRSNDLGWYTQGIGSAVSSPLTNGSPSTGNTYAAGGPPPIVYPRILISEVQTAGLSSQTEEFVELYNPTQGQVNLTDWYVQKKTQGGGSFSTFASKNILAGKTIQAKGYFLIAREGSSFASSADAVTSYSLGDNNTLAIKNPNGEIVDKLGWGDVQDAENIPAPNPQAGQSLNRIWDTANQTYYDRDNNSIDFTVHNPTSPKAKNIEDAPTPPADTTAPAAVVDLSASNPTTSSIQLAWTAPGDDDSTGIAASYDVRYGTDTIAGDNFNSATQVTGEPTPSAAGSGESMTVSGLSPETTYFFALKASDEILNVSELSNVASLATAVAPPPPQDTTVPEVTFGALSSLQSNTFFSLSWTASDPVGDVSPSGLQSIFLEYTITPSATGVFVRYNNNGVWTNWQAGSTGKVTLSSQTTSLNLRAQDGVSYAFQVSASDVAGNTSTTSSASTSVTLPKTVIINEVAWGGTKAQSTDEWLELFNTTDSSVDLTGWKVVSSDSGGPDITLAGTIAVGGFYLIERTDDLATTATAQLTASFGNGLSNTTCETLSLYNAENAVVDETACTSDGTWPAGKASPDYISMERVASTAGSSLTNWASNNLITYNNRDAATTLVNGTPGNWINGTPKQPNSTATSPTTIADGTLRFDEFSTITLTNLGSPYIAAVSIIVPVGKTLIVEPGVQVKFKDNVARLAVEGTIKAQGTQTGGITFTVTDGGAIWCGINVTSTSTSSQLDYVTIDKAQSLAGGGCNVSFITYSMYVESSAVTINNSVIQTGAGYRKLYLKNSNSTVNASTISGATLNADSVGIYVDGGSPTISNSTISNNSIGIFVNSLSNNPTIQNNTFTGNTYAVKLSSAAAVLSGNTATNNTYNGIYFEGAVLSSMTWQADAIPYIVNKFTVSVGTTLTMQAGVVVKFINLGNTNPEFVVQGSLVTQGTAANPVVFTTVTDNTVGGSNTYGGAGALSSWKRIYIASGSTGSQLTYTTLKYGGNTYYEAALYVKQSDIQLSNLTISNSTQSAIYSSFGTVSGSGVTLINNTYGFHIELGNCPTLFGTNVTANVGPTLHPSSFPSPPCSF